MADKHTHHDPIASLRGLFGEEVAPDYWYKLIDIFDQMDPHEQGLAKEYTAKHIEDMGVDLYYDLSVIDVDHPMWSLAERGLDLEDNLVKAWMELQIKYHTEQNLQTRIHGKILFELPGSEEAWLLLFAQGRMLFKPHTNEEEYNSHVLMWRADLIRNLYHFNLARIQMDMFAGQVQIRHDIELVARIGAFLPLAGEAPQD